VSDSNLLETTDLFAPGSLPEDGPTAEPRTYGGYSGKVRRFMLTVFRLGETDRLIAQREGDCNRCGRCCRIGYVCPMLEELPDGSSRCRAYSLRPPNCRKFPIVPADVHDVDGMCSYTFQGLPAAVTLPR